MTTPTVLTNLTGCRGQGGQGSALIEAERLIWINAGRW